MVIASELNFSNYYWNDDGIFLVFWLDNYKLIYQILIEMIDTFPTNERNELYPYIFIVGMGQLSVLIKKYNPEQVIISCNVLSEIDLLFWKLTYEKGLAEFFYKNKLEHRVNLINRPTTEREIYPITISKLKLKNEAVLPNGGGKDSCVSCEILKKCDIKFTWATLGATSYRKKVIGASNNPDHINISVRGNSNVPNTYKTYKGHFPYTLYTSAFMVLLSGLIRNKYIVYSNEKSSNYPNHEHYDKNGKCIMINHQYTKSFEFEKGFHQLLKRTVNNDIEYFSILKPLYEIQISRIFSHFHQYHNAFVSCNWGRWCGRCSKCAFIFMSLYPYMDETKLANIMGNNMLMDKDMLESYLELTGNKKHKPFECVGTIEENNIAMKKCIEKSRDLHVLKYFNDNIILKEEYEHNYLQNYDEQNLIPTNLKNNIKTTIFSFLNKKHFAESGNLTNEPYNDLILYGLLVVIIIILCIVFYNYHFKLKN